MPSLAFGHSISVVKEGGGSIVSNVPISSDISVRISTKYGEVIQVDTENPLTKLGPAIDILRDAGLSGQFIQQGFQIWQSTDPMELQVAMEFRFTYNAFSEVAAPVEKLLLQVVPSVSAGIGGLIPPGPSVLRALGLTQAQAEERFGGFLNAGSDLLTVKIGYMTFYEMVITNATPTFSRDCDLNGYPIWAKVDTTFRGSFVANTGSVSQIFPDKDGPTVNPNKSTVDPYNAKVAGRISLEPKHK